MIAREHVHYVYVDRPYENLVRGACFVFGMLAGAIVVLFF